MNGYCIYDIQLTLTLYIYVCAGSQTTHTAMDVTFQPSDREKFSIEVGFFDTVLEIKEKIQKYQNIPAASQTLIFNGAVLQDESNVHCTDLVQDSCVQLIQSSPDKPAAAGSSLPVSLSPQGSSRIQLFVNIPAASKLQRFPICMRGGGTVRELKENIHAVMEALPMEQLVLYSAGSELQDDYSLQRSGLANRSEIDVGFTAGANGRDNYCKMLKVMVALPRTGGKKMGVEVNSLDKVGVLRMELNKLQKCLQFYMPKDRYYLMYKKHMMDEDRTFRWHHVGQGDTIDISTAGSDCP